MRGITGRHCRQITRTLKTRLTPDTQNGKVEFVEMVNGNGFISSCDHAEIFEPQMPTSSLEAPVKAYS